MKKDTYYLMPENWEVNFSDSSAIEKYAARSNFFLKLNEETGEYKGEEAGNVFNGVFSLGRTYGGISKGIYIQTELGYLSRTASDSNKKTLLNFAQAKRLYFYSNSLVNPKYAILEAELEEGGKLVFIKRK